MEKETAAEITVDTLEDIRELIQSQEGGFIIHVEFEKGDGRNGSERQP